MPEKRLQKTREAYAVFPRLRMAMIDPEAIMLKICNHWWSYRAELDRYVCIHCGVIEGNAGYK